MDIKLIAMDLDGTALQKDHMSFSPRLEAALEAAHKQGVLIAPVTGRQFRLLPPPLRKHPVWSDLVVLCNGGQIRCLETGRCLYTLDIPESALRQLLTLSEELDIPLEFSRDSRLHLTKGSYDAQLPVENLRFHVHTILEQCGVIVESLSSLCQEGRIEKAQLPYIPSHLRDTVEQRLKSIDVSAVWASASSMEITHSLATKGGGLTQLCRLKNILPEQVMALGDSGNDITMLHLAGLGIAMGNAPETVKAAADHVTDTNDRDGAAKAIEEFVLK